MAKRQQGFAVTGSKDASEKGKHGGKKGGKKSVRKGFAVTGNAREMQRRSVEKRREAQQTTPPQ